MCFKVQEFRSPWLGVNLVLLAGCLMCKSACLAQEITPDCGAADLDASYRFLNSHSNQKVIVTFQNTSQQACTLSPGAAGVSFGGNGHYLWTKICLNCDGDGKPQSQPPLMLATGETAYMVVSWDTVRAGSTACQEVDVLHGSGISIWVRGLLGDVCSVVHVDAYHPGQFSSGRAALEVWERPQAVSIKLSPSGDVFYWDDSFWLNADISDPHKVLQLDADSCPPLFLKTKAFDGANWFEQIGARCKVVENGQGPGRSIRLRIWTEGRSAFPGVYTRAEV